RRCGIMPPITVIITRLTWLSSHIKIEVERTSASQWFNSSRYAQSFTSGSLDRTLRAIYQWRLRLGRFLVAMRLAVVRLSARLASSQRKYLVSLLLRLPCRPSWFFLGFFLRVY